MYIQYNINTDGVLHKLINQTYKLLPNREEGEDWQKPLETIIVELMGMKDLLIGQSDLLFAVLCKLKGLLHLSELQLDTEEEFQLYRRTIFECLNLISQIKDSCQAQID